MRLLFLALVLLVGCEQRTTCEVVDTQVLDWDEVSPIGFSAEDALADLSGPFDFPDAVATGRPDDAGLSLSTEKRTGNVLFNDVESVTTRSLRRVSNELQFFRTIPCVDTLSAPVEVSFEFADDAPIVMAGDMTIGDPESAERPEFEGVLARMNHSVSAWMDALPEGTEANSVQTQAAITDDSVGASVSAFPPEGQVVLLSVNEER